MSEPSYDQPTGYSRPTGYDEPTGYDQPTGWTGWITFAAAGGVEGDPAGIGATPQRCAHAASEWMRVALSPAATSKMAAVSAPTP
jgi:hypothetical protein